MKSLTQDHEFLTNLLMELTDLLSKSDVRWSFELLDLFCAQLAVHIQIENVCVFPAILNARPDRFGQGTSSLEEARTIIERLRRDHNFFIDELGKSSEADAAFA